jgi:hypothetical protein
MKCLIFQDPIECQNIEITRCEALGKVSEAYEVCMLGLGLETNATIWCENHYKDESLWVDNLSPRYL